MRVNARLTKKPSTLVGPGDTLTLVQGRAVRVIEITDIPERRGPASEAQACYVEIASP